MRNFCTQEALVVHAGIQHRDTAGFRTYEAAFPQSEAMGFGSIKGNAGIAFHQ